MHTGTATHGAHTGHGDRLAAAGAGCVAIGRPSGATPTIPRAPADA